MKALKCMIKVCLVLLFLVVVVCISIHIENINAAESYPFNGIIMADSLVVHSTSTISTSSNSVTELVYGTRVAVTGLSGSAYKITYEDNKVGYVAKSYVLNVDANTLKTDVNGIETYKDYCDTLVKDGFDESYCPYLYYLHSKHLKWIFKADKLTDTLEKASKEEENYCVLQTNNKNYWLKEKAAEADYYYIKGSVIASFMDPRNSLFESRIFQFMDNIASKDFSDDSSIKKMAGSGNLAQYSETYKKAGSDYKVNPLHLIARSKQEGANSATYKSVAGTYTKTMGYTYDVTNQKVLTNKNGSTLDGYYNYYNINATGTYAIANGLAYAAGYTKKSYEKDGTTLTYLRPWNSPQQAILGGAKFIYDSYVGAGQHTIYFEKFNIYSGTTRTKYSHQYMTNINAPQAESESIYNSYTGNTLLDSEFVFIIPVFSNMGAVEQAVNKDSDSSLSSIKINDELITGFDSDVVEYTYNAITESNSINVLAAATKETTKVTGNGSYTFVDGEVKVSIKATAEDGSSTTYNIVVKQVLPNNIVKVEDIVSKMDVKIDNNYMYGIKVGTSVSTLISTVTKNKGTAVVMNGNTKVTTGNLKTGYTIVISGTSEEKTYTIAVRGDVNGDGNINLSDFTLIQSHLLKKLTISGVKKYAADVNYDGVINLSDFTLVQSHLLKKLSL